MSRRIRPFLLVSTLAWAACRESHARAPALPADTPGGAVEAEELDFEALGDLGYVDFSEEAPEPSEFDLDGVVLRDAELSWQGYDLYTIMAEPTAVLIDAQGRELRSWSIPEPGFGFCSRLYPDGHLVLVARGEGLEQEEDGYIALLDWNGEVKWRIDNGAHHDAEILSDGSIVVLTSRISHQFKPWKACGLRENEVTLLSREGALLGRRSLYRVLTSNPNVFRPRHGRAKNRSVPVDLMHANAVHWTEFADFGPDHPASGERKVLVTFRHQNLVALFDWDSGMLRWAWGQEPGMLQLPHDGRLLASGNVLVFDNGTRGRSWSRLVEVDPLRDEVVWEYRAPNPRDFFSAARGTVQPLPNGNLLVGYSGRGEAFEITRDGRIVWRFLNPFRSPRGGRGTLRIERYAPELVEPLLDCR